MDEKWKEDEAQRRQAWRDNEVEQERRREEEEVHRQPSPFGEFSLSQGDGLDQG